ncbi:MAG: NADH-quinone oxidoreductase subunit J [Actinomycetota bacterium]|jgi:NADH-quinone oxidoreductase subunit J
MIASVHSLPDVITFVVASALMMVGAVSVIVAKNPVHSALSLIMTFFGVAIAFVEMDAQFLAAVEIIVYAGAIVVLFLFVIMFLGVDRDDVVGEPLVGQRSLAVLGVGVTVAGVITMMAHAGWVTGVSALSNRGHSLGGGYSNVNDLGTAIFTTYIYAFEATAALLIIAVVGAVVLARSDRPRENDEEIA